MIRFNINFALSWWEILLILGLLFALWFFASLIKEAFKDARVYVQQKLNKEPPL